jgi:O-antigen/teichoic acid export membrane protein
MPKSELKSIWSHSRIYALGTILNRAASFILLPVYVNVLSPDEFGVYALVAVFADVLAQLIGMGLGFALVRFYIDCDTPSERQQVVSTTFLTYGVVGLVFALLSPGLGYLSSQIVFGIGQYMHLFTIAFLALVFSVLFEIELQYVRVQKKSLVYLWISLGKSLTFLAVNIFLVVVLKMGVLGILLGTLLSTSLIASVILVRIFRVSGFVFSRRVFSDIIRFGVPIVPSYFLDSALAAVDRYFLNQFLSAGPVGYYALADRLANALRMFVAMPFAQIFVVRRLETLGDALTPEDEEFANIFLFFLILFTSAALTLALFAPELVAVFAAEDYAPAADLLPIFALCQIFVVVKLNFEIGILYAKRTGLLGWVSAATLAASIPIYYLLIGHYGLMGAAFGLLLLNLFRIALTVFLAGRVSSVVQTFAWTRSMVVVAAAGVAWFLSPGLEGGSITIFVVGIKMTLLVLFFMTMVFSPVVGTAGRKELWGLVCFGPSPRRDDGRV